MSKCRCGWDYSASADAHPCHRGCGRAGRSRFYQPSPRFALAGVQMKASVTETWACDECWSVFATTKETL